MRSVMLDPDALIAAIDGPRISIPVATIDALGLQAAAFLSQAAYLSSCSRDTGGWFDLPAEGPRDPDAKNLFRRLGSWRACLGIPRDAQRQVRRQLLDMGLLEEQRRGVPARMYYRVPSEAYLAYLSGLPTQTAGSRNLEREIPQASGRAGADQSAKSRRLVAAASRTIPEIDPDISDIGERPSPASEPDAQEHTFAEFLARCQERGEQPIPADHPAFDFSAQAGIPVEWLEVAWAEFCRRYRDNPKVHRDWRDLFFRTVRENWLRIWYVDRATGEVRLTSEGLLLQRAMDAEREEGAA